MIVIQREKYYFAESMVEYGRFRVALDLFEEMLKEEPDNIEVLFGKLSALQFSGRLDDAVALADNAILRFPHDIDFYMVKINSLMRLHRMDDAKRAMEQTLRNKPDVIYAQFYNFRFFLEDRRQTTLDDYKKKILTLAESYPKVENIKKIGTYQKDSISVGNYFYNELLEYQVWVQYHTGKPLPESLKSYASLKEALEFLFSYEVGNKSVEVEFPLALVRQDSIYDTEVRELFPGEIVGNLVEISVDNLKERDITCGVFPEIYHNLPVNARNFMEQGNIYLQLKNWDKAIEYFNNSIELDKTNLFAYLGRMCAYYKKNLPHKAIDSLGGLWPSLMSNKPGSVAMIYFHLANIMVAIGNYEPCLKLYEFAIQTDSENYRYYAMLAEMFKRTGHREQYDSMRSRAQQAFKRFNPIGQSYFRIA